MSKKDTRARRKKFNSKNPKADCLAGSYINVTEHAIRRYQERIKKINRDNALHSIVEGVKRSRLIALTKYGGREIRENRGVLFVCELQGSCMSVITVLVSEVDLRFVS